MELALGIFVSPFHPGIIRESESNALSDLSRDFDTGGTPAPATKNHCKNQYIGV